MIPESNYLFFLRYDRFPRIQPIYIFVKIFKNSFLFDIFDFPLDICFQIITMLIKKQL